MLSFRSALRLPFFVALVAVAACDADGPVGAADTVESPDAITPDAAEDTTAPAGFVASCTYENPFAGTPECREYAGTWDVATAEADCAEVFFGSPGTYTDGPCVMSNEIGRCTVGDLAESGYVIVSTGDGGACDSARLGCETFGGGTFAAGDACVTELACEAPLPATASTFVPPYLDCRAPLAGEAPGASDGQVCTMTMISASTEPGRYFPDYADCDVVRRQRPYYGAPPTVTPDPEDARLDDDAYMAELGWLTEQVRASACTCCHDGGAAPDGAAVWDIAAGPLWIDTVSDEALAMFVGLTDSRFFGYYAPGENNGFDRSATGLPTTDVARLEAFGRAELARRGLTEAEAAALPPFAPFFRELVEHEPEACPEGVGVDAEGRLTWSGASARYLSVLRAGSPSPGVQPNFDLPEGTLWAIAADPTEPSMTCGLAYGEVPSGAYQRFPVDGGAPEPLVSGTTYYLHAQRDLAFPVTRCLFVAP
ncbi:MAG: proteinase inhibitor [Deltaproteobacteria bacterium]|nr:MAG: proteinase inhibitor [Deltaproteobacteria bacterium]